MPVIDTMILFATADTKHKYHNISKKALESVNDDDDWWIPSFALVEFDLTLKSRGFSSEERMEKMTLLILKYPNLNQKILPITPTILHETCRLEDIYQLDYFDAGMAATAINIDGKIATVDKEILRVPEVEGVLKSGNFTHKGESLTSKESSGREEIY